MDESGASSWIRVASAAEIDEGQMIPVEVQGKSIALYHVEGEGFFATDNVCTHAFALLCDGWLEGNVVECPLHGGCFDVRTGKGLGAPITQDLQTYPVRVVEDEVFVAVS